MPLQAVSPEQWVAARQNYNYPAVRLVARPEAEPPFEQDDSRNLEATDFELENYHQTLLMSPSLAECRLGAASVSYWGFFGSAISGRKPTAPRALSRAKQVYYGQRVTSRVTAKTQTESLKKLTDALTKAQFFVSQSDLRGAFLAYRSMFDVGASFATKLVAFACPESAAVLDKVVCEQLVRSASDHLQVIGKRFLRVSPARQSEMYAMWCDLCAAQAASLNTRQTRWSCRSTSQNPWRPIDVERAIFSLGR